MLAKNNIFTLYNLSEDSLRSRNKKKHMKIAKYELWHDRPFSPRFLLNIMYQQFVKGTEESGSRRQKQRG